MKKISSILTIVFCLLIILNYQGLAQVKITDVKARKFRGVRSIKDKGYYAFYKSERNKGGMSFYDFHIYDLDLKLIKKATISVPKSAVLADEAFNGTHFMFAYLDARKKDQLFIIYDSKGNEVKRKTVEIDRNDVNTIFGAEKGGYKAIDIIPDRSGGGGFYLITAKKEKKMGYSVQKVNHSLATTWKKNYFPKKGFAAAVDGEAAYERLCVLQISKEKILSKKVNNDLLIFDGKTGKLLSENPLTTKTHNLMPSQITLEEDGTILLGGMYFDGEKVKAKNSAGFFMAKYSPNAQISFLKKQAWNKLTNKELQVGVGKAVIGSKPKVVFHEILKGKDGTYQLIGETFQTAISGLGVAAAALGGGSQALQNVNFTVKDFVIINFDGKTGDLKKMQFIEKEKKRFLIEGIPLNSGMAIAMYAKALGYFSYSFSEKTKTGENAVVFYNPGEGVVVRGRYIGVAKLDESKTVLDVNKTELTRKAAKNGRSGAVRSKQGQFLAWEMNKDDKSIELWIEKIK